MRSRTLFSGMLALALLAALALPAAAQQAQPEKWLHVRVINSSEKGESVRVNVPLSLAEAVLSSIKAKHIENGKVKISEVSRHGHHIESIDLPAILAAVRNAQDGEFVTVEGQRENVRVAKKAGYLIAEVRERDKDGKDREKVDVKVPMIVVEALLSASKDELDILAAIRALAKHGDTELVAVKDRNTTVRVWIDSKSTSE